MLSRDLTTVPRVNKLCTMPTLESQLKGLNPQEKRALADWLWRSAEAEPDLSQAQIDQLNSRAEAALRDPAKRFPLGDAEQKLRR